MSFYKTFVLSILTIQLFLISCSSDNGSDDSNVVVTTDDEEAVDEDSQEEMGELITSGSLESSSDYATSGNFEFRLLGETLFLNVDDTFNIAGRLPDVVIYLSNSIESQESATFISEDVDDTGAQSFQIPDGLTLSDYEYILIFCRDFNEKVGFGEIN